jgi:SAM-dependent methyltransferase
MSEQITSKPRISDPPEELVAVVGGPLDIGEGHVAQLRGMAQLRPEDHVLDVGCGIGRTAIHLTGVLSEEGAYEGFDLMPGAIEWCSREITPRYPNFRFTHVDLFNGSYNPSGTIQPAEFTFPYEDEQFDLVCLYSVFTHLLPPDLERYVAEVRRVLKPGGRVLATFFLLNEESTRELSAGVEADAESAHRAKYLLESDDGEWATAVPDEPEAMVAYEVPYVNGLFRRNDLEIGQWAYGQWFDWATGRGPMGNQDTIVAHRGSRIASERA